MDPETAVLQRFLNEQRRHVVGILEGLTGEQLRRPVLPSGWHCLGMVKHLAPSDEHYWFRCVVNGESLDYFPAARTPTSSSPRARPPPTCSPCTRRRSPTPTGSSPRPHSASRPRQPPEWNVDLPDLRAVILWVITETACHAGHLDAARELIDGRQWIVL